MDEAEVEGMDLLVELKDCRSLDGIQKVLNPIALALKFLEGDKYPTISFVQLLGYILKISIEKTLKEEESLAKPDQKLVTCYKELLKQLATRFSYDPLDESLDGYMPVDYLAAALDPRTKGLEFIPENEKQLVCSFISSFYEDDPYLLVGMESLKQLGQARRSCCVSSTPS